MKLNRCRSFQYWGISLLWRNFHSKFSNSTSKISWNIPKHTYFTNILNTIHSFQVQWYVLGEIKDNYFRTIIWWWPVVGFRYLRYRNDGGTKRMWYSVKPISLSLRYRNAFDFISEITRRNIGNVIKGDIRTIDIRV